MEGSCDEFGTTRIRTFSTTTAMMPATVRPLVSRPPTMIYVPPEFADDALALKFTDEYADHLRYVAARRRWLIYTGTVWSVDETLHVMNLARDICRQESAKCQNAKTANLLASGKTIAAVERLARADRRHAATVDQWDCDPWVLNTPRGVVDLRTGQRRPTRPDDYMTKQRPSGQHQIARAGYHFWTA